jgi:type VII secretion integral membrane protein EccD
MSQTGLCRVSIHTGAAQVDLALPAAVSIAALLPCIVDVLASHGVHPPNTSNGQGYQLSRPGAARLNSSKTLAQHGVGDGELLLLFSAETAIPAPRFDVCDAVAAATGEVTRLWTRQAARRVGITVACWLAAVAAAVLLRSVVTAQSSRHGVVAAIVSAAVMMAATTAGRVYRDSTTAVILAVLSTGFASVAGFLVVPQGPAAPNFLLAGVAGATTALIARRVTGCGATPLTSLACFAVLGTAAALAGVACRFPIQVVGSVLASASVGLLAASARISLVIAQLSPRTPLVVDAGDDPAVRAKAVAAHGQLTALVVGLTASATLGAVLTAVGGHAGGTSTLAGGGFVAVVAAVLLLCSRRHAELLRAAALITGGTVCLSMLLVLLAAPTAPWAGWVCLAALAIAAAALLVGLRPPTELSPVVRRGVDVLDCLLLAAVAPLACWVCGLYHAARGVSLT